MVNRCRRSFTPHRALEHHVCPHVVNHFDGVVQTGFAPPQATYVVTWSLHVLLLPISTNSASTNCHRFFGTVSAMSLLPASMITTPCSVALWVMPAAWPIAVGFLDRACNPPLRRVASVGAPAVAPAEVPPGCRWMRRLLLRAEVLLPRSRAFQAPPAAS